MRVSECSLARSVVSVRSGCPAGEAAFGGEESGQACRLEVEVEVEVGVEVGGFSCEPTPGASAGPAGARADDGVREGAGGGCPADGVSSHHAIRGEG